jgi:Bacterial signalling protein N terminal repeat
MATTVLLFAAKYKALEVETASILLLSTVCLLVTVPLTIALGNVRGPPATSELLRIHPFADDKGYMRVPFVDFDYRLVVLSSFIVIVATYATLAVVERMKFAQGTGWFAWLGGGASGIGIGIWSMHYLGLQTLSLPVPTLHCSSVVYSILATIFAAGITLLVIGKSDSGRSVKEENQRSMRLEIFIRNRVA